MGYVKLFTTVKYKKALFKLKKTTTRIKFVNLSIKNVKCI